MEKSYVNGEKNKNFWAKVAFCRGVTMVCDPGWGDLGTPEMSVKCSEQAGNEGRVAARSGRSERNSE